MAVGSGNRHSGCSGSARGFGLVELMTVVAIVAVLAAIALPSYSHVMKLNRLTTDANNMMAALNLARNEAITRGRPVSVCASTNGTSCAGAATDDWSTGWIVFTDYDGPGTVDGTDEVLRVFGATAHDVTMKSDGANVGYVQFSRTGVVKFPTADAPTESFFVRTTPCETDLVREISIRSLGRTASTTPTADACP
jgi:type IV fimbrial biogenesis protein FimT